MASSEDESRDEQGSLMDEALKILSQEGFTLPDDVVDTLQTVGRTNAESRRRGTLRGHRVCEVQSNSRKFRNTRESSGGRRPGGSTSDTCDDVKQNGGATGSGYGYGEYSGISNHRHDVTQGSDPEEVFTPSSGAPDTNHGRRVLERELSGESTSTCSVSTVRENPGAFQFHDRPQLERQDSGSSIASSASSFNKKQARLNSVGSDTGYNTSIENAKQTHEARADNLKNFSKDIDNKLSKRNGGLRRDLSRDSGFTESGFSSMSHHPTETVAIPEEKRTKAHTTSSHDFNDTSMSNSDVSERFVSTDAGDAHTMTSTAADLAAAEMTSRTNEITEEGTAISSVAKLENQDSSSTMLRVTNKATADAISKDDDYESVNKTSKSSRNDSLATTEDGVTTASSRHAASVEQGLYKESSKMSTSKDGERASGEMKVDQQLARKQQMHNIQQSDDGSAREENKTISEKSQTSKSHKEEKMGQEGSELSGALSASQNLDSNTKVSQSDETVTHTDGTVVKRSNESTTKSENEENTTEKKTIRREPYSGAKSTDIVRKSDTSSVKEKSKKISEVKETAEGTSTLEESEDSKSVSSSFSGVCESTDEVNGQTLQRKTFSEKSSESKVKSSRSVSSYASNNNRNAGMSDVDVHSGSSNRRLSNISNVSNLSGMSRDTVNPPTYEETLSNPSLSRQGSMSSVFSRQDSDASSIASSASAFNERQRQKQRLAKSHLEREDSGESRRPEVDTVHSGRVTGYSCNSSDSTLSGGDMESSGFQRTGRVIDHPVRLTDRMGFSRSTSASTKPINRRSTLQGDIILSERDINVARNEIRSSLTGRDDSFLDRSERNFSTRSAIGRRRDDEFGSFGTTSFKDEVMGIVDKFFDEDDDDDDFGIGFGRRNPASSFASRNGRITGKESVNPYTTRLDLSKHRDSFDSMSTREPEVEYAASDSGFPISRGIVGSGIGGSLFEHDDDFDMSDTVSESGYRSSRTRAGLGSVGEPGYGSQYTSAVPASRQQRGSNYSQYSHKTASSDSRAAGDIHQSAGKSIHNDRTSILDSRNRGHGSSVHTGIGSNKMSDENNYTNYNSSRLSGGHSGSASDHMDSLNNPSQSQTRNVSARGRSAKDSRSSSMDNLSTRGVAKDRTAGQAKDGEETEETESERKQRIGQALSWIRSELGGLRTQDKGGLRTQDKVLMSQFQRCQDSIEELKKQRPWYDVYSDDEEEYDEDREYWDDGEIEDFDRANQQKRQASQQRAHSDDDRTEND